MAQGRPRQLLNHLDHTFARPELLDEALTHASLGRTTQGNAYSYERLEFLGDRVLGLVIAERLLERFPTEDEGALARRHATLVRAESLARVGEAIGIGAALNLANGESDGGGRENSNLLADCCEAVIAALYLDGGLEVAKRFIRAQWEALIDEDPTPPKDAKTSLQEWTQGRGLGLPEYREVGREGPAHAPVFLVEVAVDGQPVAAGQGPNKRSAEQEAAGAMLAFLKEGTRSQ